MGFLVDVVHFSGQRCSPQDDIADRRFAARIGMAVEQREQQGQYAAVQMFAGQKDPFPGNEAIVKNQVGVGGPRHESAFEMLSRPQVVDRDDLLQSVPVSRNGEGHGVILVFAAQRPGGQRQDLVRHGGL